MILYGTHAPTFQPLPHGADVVPDHPAPNLDRLLAAASQKPETARLLIVALFAVDQVAQLVPQTRQLHLFQ
jgi:hypothetical protein